MLKRTIIYLILTAITMAACSVLVPEPPTDPSACHIDLPIGHRKQGRSC